jgi:hypothetical protein
LLQGFPSNFFPVQNGSLSLDAAEKMICGSTCLLRTFNRWADLSGQPDSRGVSFDKMGEALCTTDSSAANGGQLCLKTLGWTPFQVRRSCKSRVKGERWDDYRNTARGEDTEEKSQAESGSAGVGKHEVLEEGLGYTPI